MATYTPMIQQYLSIKSDYLDSFLFFRLGDFYEMFFEDAETASKILEITLTSRDGGEEQKVPMCGVPYHSADSYIAKLIDNGYKVAICEQMEDPKSAKGVVKREVVRVITPGTVMEGKKIEEKGNNYIASIDYQHELQRLGLSVSDLSTGEFYATEIEGDLNSLLTELGQYLPSEILVQADRYEILEEILQPLHTTLTKIEPVSEEANLQLIKEQFRNTSSERLTVPMINSIGQLLRYLKKTQLKRLDHFNELRLYDAQQFLVIDLYSKRNLELVKTSRDHTKRGSLVWLIDKTETPMGSRLLRRWLEKPLLSIEAIEERLNHVEDLYQDPILLEDLRNELKHIYDMERIISKISYGNATPRDIYALRLSLDRVPQIEQVIHSSRSEHLKKLLATLDMCSDISLLIKESIQDDPPLSVKEGGMIKRGFHQQLDEYYSASTDGKKWLQELEIKERTLTGIKSLKVGFNKVFGYFIEVTKSNLAQVPHDRYFRKQTLANAERYITEELKEKETKILEAEERMLDLEYRIFAEIRGRIAEHTSRLQKLAFQLAKIDVLMSFAIVSLKYHYVRPLLNSTGNITIEEGRHPVLEAIQTGQPYIPNDIQLNEDEDQILMITGPNMAGKSTYMRQIALIVIMAQMGCFVPAKKADIAVIDRIFTRIGAGDDLTSGQSTFMVEMMETKQAITEATPNSLILLDEIGRGTSTYDGMALAQAIIQYIHDHVKAKTLFSTHYHELTSLAEIYPRIQNIHVNVVEKNGKVIFLHKIEKGKADKSYGIHVAELAGLPNELIQNAKFILRELETKLDKKDHEQIQFDLFRSQNESEWKSEQQSKGKEKKYLQIIQQIETLNLLNMTPMEGFQMLYDIQKQLRK